MASKSRRWNQALFPIDDGLIEKLIDDYHARIEGFDADDEMPGDGSEPDSDGDERIVWFVDETLSDSAAAETEEDVFAVNMRVLNDYLQRRAIDAPEAVMRTLH